MVTRAFLGLALVGCAGNFEVPSPERVHAETEIAALTPRGNPREGADADALGPPYPIVLVHGFFGFESFAGVDFVNYFYDVRADLQEAGEVHVFTPAVDPFNDSHHRGSQLLERVEAIVQETGHRKVNLVGHSQGGFDARVVASLRPDLVESVTTLATPHHGNVLVDLSLEVLPEGESAELVDQLVRLIGAPLFDEIGQETSVMQGVRQLSTEGVTEFNATYPDGEDVTYYSIAGRSDLHLGGEHCMSSDSPTFVLEAAGERDAIDPTLAAFEVVLDGGWGAPYPNDGLVRVEAAKWGRFLGCIPADHLDQIGQFVNDWPGLTNQWRHQPFYRDLVRWLHLQGH